jgi:AbiV family abortive infection protein
MVHGPLCYSSIAPSFEVRFVMTTGLEAIAHNAQRLMEDADLLFSAGRFATATAIAIIAIEEAGKHYLLKWNSEHEMTDLLRPAHKGRKAHQEKQAVLGSFYLAEVAVETMRQYLRKIGFEGDDNSLQQFSNALHYFRDDPEYGRKAALVEEKVVNLVAKKMAESENREFTQNAMQGNIQETKHCGLYVDLDASGEVTRGPSQIQKEDARKWLEHANRAVALLSPSDPS